MKLAVAEFIVSRTITATTTAILATSTINSILLSANVQYYFILELVESYDYHS